MTHTMHSARIIEPLPYAKGGGETGTIPIGPCLIEQVDDRSFDIVWGARGQSCAALRVEDVKAAADVGNLVLLD
jgi:hypothetical protein